MISVEFNAGLARMLFGKRLDCINAKAVSLRPRVAQIVDKLLNITDIVSEVEQVHFTTN